MFKKWVKILITVIIVLVISGCMSTPKAGPDESIVVIFNRASKVLGSGYRTISIWLNGEEVARSSSTIRFVIPNGEHTIQAGDWISRSTAINFSANNEEIVFSVGKFLLYSISETNRNKL